MDTKCSYQFECPDGALRYRIKEKEVDSNLRRSRTENDVSCNIGTNLDALCYVYKEHIG